MPFIRQARDKRGFEYTYVLHAYHPSAGGPQRARLLYLFRSPVGARLGRTALDPEVMEALEHTHPDLSFDWQALTRDAQVTRPENGGADRPQPPQQRRPGQQRGSAQRNERNGGVRPDSRPPRDVPTAPELPPDNSVLGRTIGAGEAARMRRRYEELLQRIARRARTPEERDRLTERLKRLNPEDWSDEASVRANAPGADAGWNAISAELPSRRRGRRGGRGRGDAEGKPSGIMNSAQHNTAEAPDAGLDESPDESGSESPDESENESEETSVPGTGDADRGLGAVGSVAADSDPETPADPDVPVRD